MARPKGTSTRIPTLRLHKPSGRGVVTLAGRTHYCGKYGTPEAEQEYRRLVREFLAAGRTLPASQVYASGEHRTVNEIIALYWATMEKKAGTGCRPLRKYRKGKAGASTLVFYRSVLRIFQGMYGTTKVIDFRPLSFVAFRDELARQKRVSKGMTHLPWSRETINKGLSLIRRMFRWAVEHELAKDHQAAGLDAVKDLAVGEGGREPKKVEPPAAEDVDRVIALATPQMAAIIQVLRHTGMRQGELAVMRPIDIDTSKPVWLYRPEFHKTKYRGKAREIYLSPQVQQIIQPYFPSSTHGYFFTPEQSWNERVERYRKDGWQQRSARPSQMKRNPRNRKIDFNATFPPDTLGQAVRQLCKRAAKQAASEGKPFKRWHLHQLRHEAATAFASEYGLEVAAAILGHSSKWMTERYAKPNAEAAQTAVINRMIG